MNLGFVSHPGFAQTARRSRSTTCCKQQKDGKKGARTAKQEPKPSRPPRLDAYNIAETVKDSPSLNSVLMNAMRDYFGDDGREVQEYMQRQLNADGKAMFRVVVVGSGGRELETMKKLSESGVITGLYYCADEEAVCDLEMSKYGRSSVVSAYNKQGDVVAFSKWCVADAVFVGPDREGCINRESEKMLADAGITVFPHDVTAAIADGLLEVSECLEPLIDEESDLSTEELVE